jgi:hypothetical protein
MTVGENFIFIGCAEGIVRCFSPSTLQFVTTLPRTHYLGVDVAQGLSIRFVVIEYFYVFHCCGVTVQLQLDAHVTAIAGQLCLPKKQTFFQVCNLITWVQKLTVHLFWILNGSCCLPLGMTALCNI